MHPTALFDVREGNSQLLTHLHVFVHHIVRSLEREQSSPTSVHITRAFRTLTPLEIDMFYSLQCTLLLRLFDFVSLLLERFAYGLELTLLLDEAFFTLLFECILRPEDYAFTPNKLRQLTKLRNHTQHLCQLLTPCLTENQRKLMEHTLRSILSQDTFNVFRVDFCHANMNVEYVLNLLRGYLQLHTAQLLLPYLPCVLTLEKQHHHHHHHHHHCHRSQGNDHDNEDKVGMEMEEEGKDHNHNTNKTKTKKKSDEIITEMIGLDLATHLLGKVCEHSPHYTPLEMLVGSSLVQLAFAIISSSLTVAVTRTPPLSLPLSSSPSPATTSSHNDSEISDRNNLITQILLRLLLDDTVVVTHQMENMNTMSHVPLSTAASSTSSTASSSSLTKNSTKGELFYKNFCDQIDEHIILHISHYVKPLIDHLHSHPLIFRILLNMLDRHLLSANQKRFDSKKFIHCVCDLCFVNILSLFFSLSFCMFVIVLLLMCIILYYIERFCFFRSLYICVHI
jgi:hypothetical protein